MAKIFEAMQKKGFPALSSSGYLDLKNRKQLGDLSKTILSSARKNQGKAFVVASCREGEGVSTLVANLVVYCMNHQPERSILVVDCNFQAPVLHRMLGLQEGPGLAEVLNGDIPLEEAVQPLEGTCRQAHVLSCGQAYKEMAGNLDQTRFSNFLTAARDGYDSIVIDCPPILASPETLSAAAAADGLFLMVQSLKVQSEVALKAKVLLANNECEVCGVILNRVRQVIPSWMYRLI